MKAMKLLLCSTFCFSGTQAQDTASANCWCFMKDAGSRFEYMILKRDQTFLLAALSPGKSKVAGNWKLTGDTLLLDYTDKSWGKDALGQEYRFTIYDRYLLVKKKGVNVAYRPLLQGGKGWIKPRGAYFYPQDCAQQKYFSVMLGNKETSE